MAIFPLLAAPDEYVACDWDLTADRAGLDYWIEHFALHCTTLEPLIRDVYAPADHQFQTFRDAYLAELHQLHQDPARYGRVTILALDKLRDSYLRRFGFDDPYRNVKRKENEAALKFYPRLVSELDSQPAQRRLGELIVGVFAGNIFDLGAMATVKEYHSNGLDFFATRARLAQRPWLIDDADALARAFSPGNWQYRKIVFFVDNAGCDFVLGCLPLIREFACRRQSAGRPVEVVIAVNTGPSLNDILAGEVEFVLSRAAGCDPLLAEALGAGRLRIVPSGNKAPLIDLSDVTDELAHLAADADLLILEGMGRSVESNHFVRFSVDIAKLALLKDPRVAGRLGGKLYDICCKFEKA